MLRDLQVLLRRSFRHPDESIKRGLIYTSVCDHSGTATVNGVARRELTPPCSNTRMQNARTHVQPIPFAANALLNLHTHTHVCVHTQTAISSCLETHTHTQIRVTITAYEVFWSGRSKGEGGGKVCKHECLSDCLSIAHGPSPHASFARL